MNNRCYVIMETWSGWDYNDENEFVKFQCKKLIRVFLTESEALAFTKKTESNCLEIVETLLGDANES